MTSCVCGAALKVYLLFVCNESRAHKRLASCTSVQPSLGVLEVLQMIGLLLTVCCISVRLSHHHGLHLASKCIHIYPWLSMMTFLTSSCHSCFSKTDAILPVVARAYGSYHRLPAPQTHKEIDCNIKTNQHRIWSIMVREGQSKTHSTVIYDLFRLTQTIPWCCA